MKRLIEKTVFFGLVTACRLAACPTSRSPFFVNATIDGVVRAPSAFGMTTGSPPSMTAMHEFVVPRSIPSTFDMISASFPDDAQATSPVQNSRAIGCSSARAKQMKSTRYRCNCYMTSD